MCLCVCMDVRALCHVHMRFLYIAPCIYMTVHACTISWHCVYLVMFEIIILFVCRKSFNGAPAVMCMHACMKKAAIDIAR